jgi:hypothetical protein
MGQQVGHVLGALAQGRHHHGQHVEPVEQVLAEGALADGLAQVLVGGRDDAHVHLAGHVAAQGLDLVVLEHAQQRGLEVRGHVADLVQEHGAPGGGLEQADLVAVGPGEGPALVAEQLAGQQGARDGAAVLDQEGLAVAGADAVDLAGQDLLAHAGFAGDEHGVVVGGVAARQAHGVAEGGGSARPPAPRRS